MSVTERAGLNAAASVPDTSAPATGGGPSSGLMFPFETVDDEALMQLREDVVEVIWGHHRENSGGMPRPAYDPFTTNLRDRLAHKAIETGIEIARMRAFVDSYRAAGLTGLATEYDRQQLLLMTLNGSDFNTDWEEI